LDQLGGELQEVFATHAMRLALLPEARHFWTCMSPQSSPAYVEPVIVQVHLSSDASEDPWDGTREEGPRVRREGGGGHGMADCPHSVLRVDVLATIAALGQ
jgi:hypothetical protein